MPMIQYSRSISIHPVEGRQMYSNGQQSGSNLNQKDGNQFTSGVAKALDKLARLPTGRKLIAAIDDTGYPCHIFSGGKTLKYDGCAQAKDTRCAQQEYDRMVISFRPRVQNLLVREKDRTSSEGKKTPAEKYWEKKFKQHLGYNEVLYRKAVSCELHNIMSRLAVRIDDPWRYISQISGKTIKELVDISLGRTICDDATYYKICFMFYDYLSPGKGIPTQVRLTPQIYAEGLNDHWWHGKQNYKGDWTAAREDIMVGHELIHAWRMMAGKRVVRGGWEEEAKTVGLAFAAGWEFTENRLRNEAGHPRRINYNHTDFSSAWALQMSRNGTQ
ncbi:hypothetical protein HR060_02085 [Catenovulum sp. SM1970]|uniref:M91 family zinc metallopeptidase n=1 Tax=Marinifaba aquimaris TaxID=2741323 RepID=UPI001572A8DD|nr:M91 family zinc metallopeptidase [Marinifaba aquimaris]NTS75644.1 hypothetical protein [Marinifaba aquimaris]